MVRPFFLCVLAVALTGCAGTDYDGSSPARVRPPTVALPTDLNENEIRHLPEVEDALVDAGYRTTLSSRADFILEVDLEAGPVNADSHLRLLRDGSIVARGDARVGGPRIIFQRSKVVAESFRKALDQFEEQLPPARSTRPTWRAEEERRSSSGGDYQNPDDGHYRRSAPRYEDDYVPR